jgi:hypothetical protein
MLHPRLSHCDPAQKAHAESPPEAPDKPSTSSAQPPADESGDGGQPGLGPAYKNQPLRNQARENAGVEGDEPSSLPQQVPLFHCDFKC